MLAVFDCRLGSYDTADEAMGLVLWRAYDCGVNGVSDAVHHTGDLGKEVKRGGTLDKLRWMQQHSMLPMPSHQAYGTLFLMHRDRYGLIQPANRNGQPENVLALLAHSKWKDFDRQKVKDKVSERMWCSRFVTPQDRVAHPCCGES